LFELGADPAKRQRGGGSPLEYVLGLNRLEAVPVLVEHSPADVLRKALLITAGKRKPELMRQILARLPDPASALVDDDSRRLTTALLLMSDTEARILEEAGLQMPLWAAARFGRIERMKELIASGTDVNESRVHASRETPLLMAVRNRQLEAVKLLLANQADPNITSENNTRPTPLHEAAEKSELEAVRLLLSHGASVNAVDTLEQPPLYFAVTAQNLEVSRALLEAGADPNIKVWTAKRGHQVKVRLWQLATDPELIKLLKAHGAK
jgi:ankyrin repeat protein